MYKVLRLAKETKLIKKQIVQGVYVKDEKGNEFWIDIWKWDVNRGFKVDSMINILNIETHSYTAKDGTQKTAYSAQNTDVSFADTVTSPAAPTTAPVKPDGKTDLDKYNAIYNQRYVQEKQTQKSICLSYANDLAVARPDMSVADILTAAETYTQWIYAEPPAIVDKPDESVDNEIPFD